MKNIRITYYGQLAEIIGSESLVLSVECAKVKELSDHLVQLYPRLKDVRFSLSAENRILKEEEVLSFDQVDVFPPFSGG